MRVMFVGPEKAGKTTLVYRIMRGTFQDQSTRTDGVSMKNWKVEVRQQQFSRNLVQDDSFSVSLWDFAGQEVYLNSHPMFFSDRILYLLLWNPLTSADTSISTLEQYVVHIRSRTKTAPIISVTTHSHEIAVCDDDECVRAMKSKCSVLYRYESDRIKNFPLDNRTAGIDGEDDGCLNKISSTWSKSEAGVHVEWKHFSLDSKEGDGVDQLKDSIIQFIKAYSPPLSLPGWYNAVEIHLRSLPPRFSIGREEFRSICCSCWADAPPAETEDSIKSMLSLYHRWGYLYLLPDPSCPSSDDSDANGDIVLNPQDLADVFKAVITFVTPLEDGVLFHDQAYDIWPEHESKLYPQFLSLFHNCEMAYEIVDSEGNPTGKSLVPSRLPEPPSPLHQMSEYDLRAKMFGAWDSKSDPALKVKNHMIFRQYCIKITFVCLLPNFFPKLLVRLLRHMSSSVCDYSRRHCVIRLPERGSGFSSSHVDWSLCCVVEDPGSRSLFVYPGGSSYCAILLTCEAVQGLLNESFSEMVLENVEGVVDGNVVRDVWQELFSSPSNKPFTLRYYLEKSNSGLTTDERIQLYKLLIGSVDIFSKECLGLHKTPAILWLVGKKPDSDQCYLLYPISPSLSPTEPWSIIWDSTISFRANGQSIEQSELSKVLLRLLPFMFPHNTLPFADNNVEWIGFPNLSMFDEVINKISGKNVPHGFQVLPNLCGQSVFHRKQKFKGLDEALYQIASANDQKLHVHLLDKLLCIDIPDLKNTLMSCQKRIGDDYWHTYISAKQMISENPSLNRVALLQIAMLKDPRIEDHWKRKILFGLLISQGLIIVKEADTIVAPIHESTLVDFDFRLHSKVHFLLKYEQSEHQSIKPPDLIFFCKNTVEGMLVSGLVQNILHGLASLSDEDHLRSSFRLKSVSSVMNKLFYRGKELSDLFAASAKNVHEFQNLINLVRACGGIFFNRSTNRNGSEVLRYYRMLEVDVSAFRGDGQSYDPLHFPVFYEIVLLISRDRTPHEVYELDRLTCTLFKKFEESHEVRELFTRRQISFEHPGVPFEEKFDG